MSYKELLVILLVYDVSRVFSDSNDNESSK
jgi:hypothetical protein